MSDDFIPALQSFGYTQREAAFLYLVAIHSGYFVRRQFDYFIERNKGAIVTNFLAKAQSAGHIEVIEYARGWRVYHLHSRTIYQLANVPESQNRQRKGDSAIRSSLMALDYILEIRDEEHILDTPEEKINFFQQHRHLPSRYFQSNDGELWPVLKSSVISLDDRGRPSTSLVRLLFVDEGLLSMTKFRRVMEELEPLLCGMDRFELIYGSNSDRNFKRAEKEFWKRFDHYRPKSGPTYDQDLYGNRSALVPNRGPFAGSFVTIHFQYAYPPTRQKENPRVLQRVQPPKQQTI